MENPTFVVEVDSTDIDGQLYDQFVAVRSLVGDVQHAGSISELRSLLAGEGGEVIFSTLQKFQKGDTEAVHPVLSERRNLIVIADEAHRSQYGLTEGFAHDLRRALPNASFIGFTGTPISFASADTQAVFGEVIHTYDMRQSREDRSTVPVYYEPRLIRLELTNEQIDEELTEITEEAGGTATQMERARWAAIAEAAGTKKRVADLAQSLLTHFQQRTTALNGKAMVVCMTRRNCVKLYDALTKLPGCPEVKIVMTGNLSEDPPEWSQAGHITTKPQREAIKARMKDIDDPLKIVIVRDMWLTGTDIPCLHTLYVDKPMKGHTLMQAIARVNRIFQDKPGGLVVDFIGISDQLKEATKKYTTGGGGGAPAPNIDKEAKDAFLNALKSVRKFLPVPPAGKTYGAWRHMPNIEFEDLFLECCAHLTETDELRDDFLAAEARLNSAFSLVNHLSDCIGYADEVVFYQLLRKQLNKTTSGPSPKDGQKAGAVRDLLDRSIESKGVVDIFAAAGIDKPDISILDDKFLEEFQSHKFENLRLKLLTKILNDEFSHRQKQNVVKYKSFKKMLEDTLLKYHNRAIQAADVVRIMIQIKRDMEQDEARAAELGLTGEEKAFYDAVAANSATVYDQQFLCDLVRDVVQAVKRNLKVDWCL